MAAPKEVPELIQDKNDKSIYRAEEDDIMQPYYAKIPHTLTAGTKLTVCGEIPSNADTFSINLVRNKDSPSTFPQSGCMLHFNPRFKKKVVVRNNAENGQWQKEERTGATFPFSKGGSFEVQIRMQKLGYKILVDDEYFCDFTRTGSQYKSAKYIYAIGDVRITSVELRYPSAVSNEDPPPYPGDSQAP